MNKQARIEAARLTINNLKLDALMSHGWTRGAAQMGLSMITAANEQPENDMLQASAHPYREALR